MADLQQQQDAPPPAPGTPEYDAAMVAKFEKVTGAKPDTLPAPPAPSKPAEVPDKFWNAEKGTVDYAAWAKSTAELEAKFTKERQQPQPPAPPNPPKDEAKAALEAKVTALKADANAKPEDVAAAEKALADYVPPAAPKVDIKAYAKELTETGQLSEESYNALEKSGYDREFVDQYIAGQKAIAEQRAATGYQLVGGKEQFTAMTAWAAANLSHEEKVAFNDAVVGTDAQMRQAIESLKSRYQQANGSPPKLLGGSPPATGENGFKSKAEMTAAMRDPRYAKDPAYRQSVERKVAASTAF